MAGKCDVRVSRAVVPLFALSILGLAPLQARAQEANPCDGIDCNGHGMCIPYEGEATCACDPGFAPAPEDMATCVPDPNAAVPAPPAPPPPEPSPPPPPAAGEEGATPPPPPEQPEPVAVEPPPPAPAPVQGAPRPEPTIVQQTPTVPLQPPPTEPVAPEPAEPPPPARLTVPVSFSFGLGSQRIVVTMGEERFECRAPCTLDLPPGTASVGPAAGSWSDDATLVVPDTAVQANIVRTRGRGLRIAGYVLLGIGAAGMVPGFAVTAATENDGAGLGIAIPSALAFVTGLVLMAVSPEAYRVDVTAAPAE